MWGKKIGHDRIAIVPNKEGQHQLRTPWQACHTPSRNLPMLTSLHRERFGAFGLGPIRVRTYSFLTQPQSLKSAPLIVPSRPRSDLGSWPSTYRPRSWPSQVPGCAALGRSSPPKQLSEMGFVLEDPLRSACFALSQATRLNLQVSPNPSASEKTKQREDAVPVTMNAICGCVPVSQPLASLDLNRPPGRRRRGYV